MTQFQENARSDGGTDRPSFIGRTLPATVGGPIRQTANITISESWQNYNIAMKRLGTRCDTHDEFSN